MSVHWLSVLSGFIGGVVPGGIHLAWTFTRNNKVNSGTIDLTLRKKLK
jgi:hypothetical protein